MPDERYDSDEDIVSEMSSLAVSPPIALLIAAAQTSSSSGDTTSTTPSRSTHTRSGIRGCGWVGSKNPSSHYTKRLALVKSTTLLSRHLESATTAVGIIGGKIAHGAVEKLCGLIIITSSKAPHSLHSYINS